MARRVWITPQGTKIDDTVIQQAKANNCPEIANGIPPALQAILKGKKLPLAYEEPESPMPAEPIDLEKELDELRTRVAELEKEKLSV